MKGTCTFTASSLHIAQNGKGVVTVGDGTGTAKIVAKELSKS
jgi:hypothetical protein